MFHLPHSESSKVKDILIEIQGISSRLSSTEQMMNEMNKKINKLSSQNEMIIGLLKRGSFSSNGDGSSQPATSRNDGLVCLVSNQLSTEEVMSSHYAPIYTVNDDNHSAPTRTLPKRSSSNSMSDRGVSERRRGSSHGEALLNAHTVYIEMAATFSKSKFETTFTAIRKTQITPSHVLCFYYTSLNDAKFILDNGFISSTQQCDGIPLSMHGPNEIVEDETDDKAALVLAEQEVVLALSVPRRLLWGFPSDSRAGKASIDNKVSGSFRIIPSQLLLACSRTYTLPTRHSVVRAYQLINENDDNNQKEEVDNFLGLSCSTRTKRFVCHSLKECAVLDEMCDLSAMLHEEVKASTSGRTLQHKNSSASLQEKTKATEMQQPKSFEEYHEFMELIRIQQRLQPSTLLLYHYTNPEYVASILNGGLRMSTQGQGDGGVYFSLLGPVSYGFGTTIGSNGVKGEDYESKLIIDCYGKERLDEYYGKGLLSLVLVCVVEEGLLLPAPGGRDNALMVPKEMCETLCYLDADGYYYLPPTCIRGAFNLESSFSSSHVVSTEQIREVENIEKLELENDTKTAEKAKSAMKKLMNLSGSNILAVLPSSVPELPDALLARADILDQLKRFLIPDDHISAACLKQLKKDQIIAAKSVTKTCLLVGMGGMGKSTIVVSFAHDTEVRSSFDKIVWISLGQAPDIQALQESVHLQLTGEPIPQSISLLPPSIIPQQRKEALKLAASSCNVLLILDDVWESAHEHAFNILDPSTASARLISSRIRGLVKQQQCSYEVEVSSLSNEDALMLLIAKSGLDEQQLKEEDKLIKSKREKMSDKNKNQHISFGESSSSKFSQYELSKQVVELTRGFPLTISIAAGLIEANGSEVSEDLVDMMREEKRVPKRSPLPSSSSSSPSSLSHHESVEDSISNLALASNTVIHHALEDRLITASLSMFKDDSQYLAMSCFLCLAGFAEDCPIPSPLIESLSTFLVSDAQQRAKIVIGESKDQSSLSTVFSPAPLSLNLEKTLSQQGMKKHAIEVRKMMTSLVKVNLISGSFSEPFEFTVHDLIRDYAIARASKEFVTSLHSQIILELLHRLNDALATRTFDQNMEENMDSTMQSNKKLMSYIDGYLHFHIKHVIFNCENYEIVSHKGFEDALNEEWIENVVISEDWLRYIRSKTIQTSLARALGLKGIKLYAQKRFREGDKALSAKIYFLANTLLSKRFITYKENMPFLEKASAILYDLEKEEDSGDSDEKKMDPKWLCVQLEVINKHLMACTDPNQIEQLEQRMVRTISKFKSDKDYYLKANRAAYIPLLDSEDDHLEFQVLYSLVTHKISQLRQAMFRAEINYADYVVSFRECYSLCLQTAQLAPHKSLQNLFRNITPLNTMSFSLVLLPYDEIFMREFDCLANLRQGIEFYDYEVCGHILKEFGKGVDHFLQGHVTLYLLIHQDYALLDIYCEKAIKALQKGYERGLKTYHFIWIEVVGSLLYTVEALLEVKKFDTALKFMRAVGFESLQSFEQDFGRFWSDPSRNLGDGIYLPLKYTTYFLLILSLNQNQLKQGSGISILSETKASSSISPTTPMTETPMSLTANTPLESSLFTVDLSILKDVENVGRFRGSAYSSICPLAVQVFYLFEMYEEAKELAEYALYTPDTTLKATARSILHRWLAKIYFLVEGDKKLAENHLEQSMEEGKRSCFRDFIHSITKAEGEEIFKGK